MFSQNNDKNKKLKQIHKRFEIVIKDPLFIEDQTNANNEFLFYFGEVTVSSLVDCFNKEFYPNYSKDDLCVAYVPDVLTSKIYVKNKKSKEGFDMNRIEPGRLD